MNSITYALVWWVISLDSNNEVLNYLYSDLESKKDEILKLIERSAKGLNHYLFKETIRFENDNGFLVAHFNTFPLV